MIFVQCTKSAHAIGQRVYWLPSNNESFENSTHGKRALFGTKQQNAGESVIILIMKQVLKVRKEKQSGALPYLQINKLDKDVGVLYSSKQRTQIIY